VSSCNIPSKLVKRLQRYRKCLNISLVWHENGYLRFFRCFWVKKRKLSVVSSLYECTDLELKLQWLICIVAANFIRISETIAEISHLTLFLNGSINHLEFFLNLTCEQLLCSGKLLCKIPSKLVKRLQRYRKSLNISLVWHKNGYLRFFSLFLGK